jgi:hypothetical protein
VEQFVEKQPDGDTTDNSENNSGTGPAEGTVLPPPKRGRVENLRPFRPGHTGNPKGRPKKGPLTTAITKHLGRRVPPEIYDRLSEGAKVLLGKRPTVAQLVGWMHVQQCLKGDAAALRELYNRVEGRNPAIVNLQTTDKLAELQAALMAGPMEPGTSHPPQQEDDDDLEDDD